jgi:hypothetical protein
MTDTEKSIFASTYAARLTYWNEVATKVVTSNTEETNKYAADPLSYPLGPKAFPTPWADVVFSNDIASWCSVTATIDAYAAVGAARSYGALFVTVMGMDTDGMGAYLADLINLP